MLAVTSYKKAYVDQCRAKIEQQLATYGNLAKSPALEAFAPGYFNTMLLALDHYFLHRLRNAEGKDGNALNEVRMLCNAIMENGGVMIPDKSIKYDAAKSVTKLAFGDAIRLDAAVFQRLAKAFFDEIETRYP